MRNVQEVLGGVHSLTFLRERVVVDNTQCLGIGEPKYFVSLYPRSL